MAQRAKYISGQLRSAIEASGISRYAICKACDIDKGQMSRFMAGQGNFSLKVIDRLAVHLDLVLVKRSKAKGK